MSSARAVAKLVAGPKISMDRMYRTARKVVVWSLVVVGSQRTSLESTLQQDEVVAWRDTRLAVGLLCLPPPPADVRDFEDVVLLEADLVGVVGVRLVAVDGLCTIRVLDALLCRLVLHGSLRVHAAKGWCGAIAALGTGGTTGISGDGRRGFEAVELGRCVHLRLLAVGDLGLRAVGVAVGDGAGRARARVLLVQGVRVDESAVARGRLGSVVEDPYNLRRSVWFGLVCTGGKSVRRSWKAECSRQLRPRRGRLASRPAS